MVNIRKPVVHADTATYVKVANYPGLYRHSRSGRYYACKKLHGVRRERSLETCDRKIAERRLKEWVGNLEKVDAEVEKTTLEELIERYHAVTASLSESSRATDRSIIKKFLAWWPHGRDCQVRQIRPSMLDEWLAHEAPRLRNVSYNGYTGFLKQLFSIAVKDRIITLDDPSGARGTFPRGIDGAHVVGYYVDSSGVQHGFVYTISSQTFATVDNPSADAGTSSLWGVSGNTAVGSYASGSKGYGQLYSLAAGSFTPINHPWATASTSANGTDGLSIVGAFQDASNVSKGYVYNIGTQTFTTLNYPGATGFTIAYGVAGGSVVGLYDNTDGVHHGFLAVSTVPEPSQTLLGVMGALAVGFAVKRHRLARD